MNNKKLIVIGTGVLTVILGLIIYNRYFKGKFMGPQSDVDAAKASVAGVTTPQ